jgi:hypothetical protein
MPLEYKEYLVAAIGALVLELAYWYELRFQLDKDKYKKVLTSPFYWSITTAMILISPVAVLVWFSDDEKVGLKTYLIMGATFPYIFKNAVAVIIRSRTKLGARAPVVDVASTYFTKR